MAKKFQPEGLLDPIFAGLFLLNVIVFVGYAISMAATGQLSNAVTTISQPDVVAMLQGNFSKVQANPDLAVMVLIGVSLVLSVACAGTWMYLLQTYPKEMVTGSMYIMAGLMVVAGLMALAAGNILGGLFTLVFAGIILCIVMYMKDKLEMTAKVVDATSRVYSNNRKIFAVAAGCVGLMVLWMILSCVVMLPTISTMKAHQRAAAAAKASGQQPPPANGGAMLAGVFFVFCFYRGIQVFSNILHVSCSGVVARYYHSYEVETAVEQSTKQAFTNYLGPIAFGSMLIAIIQTMRTLVRMAAENARENENVAIQVVACVADCLLGCVENLAKLFNNFCFIIVAVYGTNFCDSGQKVIDLMGEEGSFERLIAYNFAGLVCFVGSLCGALLVAAVTAVLGLVMSLSGGLIGIGALIGFCVGMGVMVLVARVVESGCDTLILCYCEEPAALKRTDPVLHEAFGECKSL